MSEPLWIEKLALLPSDARSRIRRYIEEGNGASLSTFYRAILSNDLIGSIQGGDAENRAALPDFAEYLTSYAPEECYGSPKKLDEWRGIANPYDPNDGKIHIYHVQVETSSGGDEWINANVTGSAREAGDDYNYRARRTGDVQRVRLKRDGDVIAISDGSTPART